MSRTEALVEKGNAQTDGRPFQNWIAGDFSNWQAGIGEKSPRAANLRNTRKVEVKWAIHQPGDVRPGGWTSEPDRISLSILVRGHFVLSFRADPQDAEPVRHELTVEGDYCAWPGEVEHSWRSETESVVVTVRWVA